MLSAPAVKKADDSINEAKKAIRELLQSREWESKEQADQLFKILTMIERANTEFIKLECDVYGFELWKYLTDDAIKAEAWKGLEAERKAKAQESYKLKANASCRKLGLEIPYPEMEKL